MASTVETFQVSQQIAEAYESQFVPRLFAKWAPHVVDAAAIAAGSEVLDVACGTGAVTRVVADRLAGSGRVVGLDSNQGMLAVAKRLRPDIEWHSGDAASLPFESRSFDAVLCQAALMFFPDQLAALMEMRRVVRPGGVVAVQVWASLESQPAYSRFIEIVSRRAGPDAAALVSSYWSLGDHAVLHRLFADAGLDITRVNTLSEFMHFDAIDELVQTEVEGTPLGERIDEETRAAILEDTRAALAGFRGRGNGAEIPIVGHVITAVPRPS